MALKRALLAPTFFALALHSALAWKRVGLGRPIWAHAQPSNLTLLSATGTLASIDAITGDIHWRVPAPFSATSVTPRAVFLHEDLLYLALSNDRVRAVMNTGDVLWELPGCGIAHASQRHVLPVQECGSTTYRFVDFKGNSTYAVEEEPHPVPALNLLPTELTWKVDDVVITSQSDGLLRATREKNILWEREEGLSHPRHAAVYVTKVSSVLVLLSELGTLFGLSAEDGTVKWKLKAEGDCRLYTGHKTAAVVACTTTDGGTTAFVADTASGKVLERDSINSFISVRAALGDTDTHIPRLQIMDEDGVERTLLRAGDSTSKEVQSRPWLTYSKHGLSISAQQNGKTVWNVNMPLSSQIVAVTGSKPMHPISSRVRPPAVRVTGDRRLLHKYTDPNLALVLSHDEKETETHALLIDTYTGTVHDIVTHPATALPASAVKGESWFAYSLWSTITMQQEVHIVDMYHHPRNFSWVRGAIRSAVSQSIGPRIMGLLNLLAKRNPEQCPIDDTASESSQCAANADPEFTMPYGMPYGMPYFVRSSCLLTERVQSLDLTQTLMGLTEPAVIITLESGQVTLVSKFLLDARRPKEMNSAYADEYLPKYQPIISLRSHSRDSRFVDDGNPLPGVKTIAVAPHHTQESICQIAVVGTDLVYSVEYPAGNFDSLPEDFFYSGVVGMILTLIIAYMYTRGLNVKASLTKSW